MKVSAIILTYNRAHMLREAIESVLNQTYEDFELIVVDNYSSDNTEPLVKSYSDKRIRYFKNQNNGFIGINRNFGIEKSHGEYIAFLDDDDLWLPEKLTRQVQLLDSDKEIGLIYSDCCVIDSNGDLIANSYFHGRKPVRGNTSGEFFQNNPVPMLTVVIRKEVLDKIGMFNPIYRMALDYDLWLRIAEYYPIDYIEQSLAKYRVHSESGYHLNTVSHYQETLQIMDDWLSREKDTKRRFIGKIKQNKVRVYLSLISYHFQNHNRGKALRESVSLIRLFPYSLVIIPLVIASLSRSLTRC
ncbi:glycosyltransferase [Chloroflexota bacterium]